MRIYRTPLARKTKVNRKNMWDGGLTDRDIELWKERRKLDKECSVEMECGIHKISIGTTVQ